MDPKDSIIPAQKESLLYSFISTLDLIVLTTLCAGGISAPSAAAVSVCAAPS